MSARCNTLFVQGLSPLTRAKDLASEFGRIGILTRCDIPLSKGISKRYGFVEFREESNAEKAIHAFTNTRIDGHLISVEHARVIPSYEWRQPTASFPPAPMRSKSPPRRTSQVTRRSPPRLEQRRFHNPPLRYPSPGRSQHPSDTNYNRDHRPSKPSTAPRRREYPRMERDRDRDRDRYYSSHNRSRSPNYQRSAPRKRRRSPSRDSPPRKYSRSYH